MKHLGFLILTLLFFNVVDIIYKPVGRSCVLDERGIMRLVPSFSAVVVWFVFELFYWTISIFFL